VIAPLSQIRPGSSKFCSSRTYRPDDLKSRSTAELGLYSLVYLQTQETHPLATLTSANLPLSFAHLFSLICVLFCRL